MRTAYNYIIPPSLATCVPYKASRLLVPTTKQKPRAQISSYCTSTRANPACHCRSYRHTNPPYEWQQAREIKTSGYCSQAGHLHSTVCSDRDRRGPCTLHCSGASPEGSSAPEARSHPSPAPRYLQSCPVGGPSRWPHCKIDAWGHVMQKSSISSCKVTTLAVVIPDRCAPKSPERLSTIADLRPSILGCIISVFWLPWSRLLAASCVFQSVPAHMHG